MPETNSTDFSHEVGAVVLAAGRSSRMGKSKIILPWGKTTVIGQIINTLLASNIRDIIVVTGGYREQVESILDGFPIKFVNNPFYESNEMHDSLQLGIKAAPDYLKAILVVLGDQPQILESTIIKVMEGYLSSEKPLIIPSFNMKRGHPWLVRRSLWQEIIELHTPATLRDFIQKHPDDIEYLVVPTTTVLEDLDTPEDYNKHKP
jgi:molybdenum cofactor cytidylyltransferase